MQNTLRSLVVASFVLVSSALAAKAVQAAATLDVPFTFTVGGRVCPAGRYSVRMDNVIRSVELQGASQSFNWILHPGDPAPTDRSVVLRFVHVGSQYVLRSIQFGPMITSRLDKTAKAPEIEQGGAEIAIRAGE